MEYSVKNYGVNKNDAVVVEQPIALAGSAKNDSNIQFFHHVIPVFLSWIYITHVYK